VRLRFHRFVGEHKLSPMKNWICSAALLALLAYFLALSLDGFAWQLG
jgi:hypothetical protein